MKKLLIALVALATASAFAEGSNKVEMVKGPNGKMVVKKIDRKQLQAAIYRRTGGKIKVPDVQKGKIVYVNAQKKAPVDWLITNSTSFAQSAQVEIEVIDGTFEFPDTKIHGNATLYVIDDEKMPTILHAPESGWCAINVAPLAKGAGEKPQFFAARVQKELTRAFATLAGGIKSGYPHPMTDCITKPEQLDKILECSLPMDVMDRFAPYLKGYGIVPYQLVTYKQACQEGWAPAPTNDVQKAVWDKVHAIPQNPMKIEFDPKRDK